MHGELINEPAIQSQSALPLPDPIPDGPGPSQKIKNWILSHLVHGLIAILSLAGLGLINHFIDGQNAVDESLGQLSEQVARIDERQKSDIENLGTLPGDVRDLITTLKYTNEKLIGITNSVTNLDSQVQDLKHRVTTLEAKQPARDEWRRAFSAWLENQ